MGADLAEQVAELVVGGIGRRRAHVGTSSARVVRRRTSARLSRDFTVPTGHVERRRGLGLAELGEVPQGDHLPVALGQRCDRIGQPLPLRTGFVGALRIGRDDPPARPRCPASDATRSVTAARRPAAR